MANLSRSLFIWRGLWYNGMVMGSDHAAFRLSGKSLEAPLPATQFVVPSRRWRWKERNRNVSPLLTQIASAVCWTIYGSFYEWFFHKYWMHQPRTPKEAFRGHTIVHHGLYKGDDSYFVREGEHPEHILLKPYALPLIVLMHLPIVLLIERFLVPNTAWGGIVACLVYFLVYEYMHWNMHVPRNHFVERFRWFQFLRAHHKLHHRYAQKNFCVLFPLADWIMGTAETEASLAQRKAEREQAIARGEVHAVRKEKSRGSRARGLSRLATESPLSRSFAKYVVYRQRRQARKQARWKRHRQIFQLTKGRRNV